MTSESIYVHFMDKYFPTLEKRTVEDDDNYGVTGHSWYFGTPSAKIAGVFDDETAAVTYAGGTTAKTITTAYPASKWASSVEFWRNGEMKASDMTFEDITSVPYGATVALYKNDAGKIYKALVTLEYLAEVTAVTNTDKDAYDNVTFKVYDSVGCYNVSFDDTALIAPGTYTKGDFYVVVPFGDNTAADEFLSVVPATSFDGVISSYSSTSVTVGGTKSYVSALAYDMTASDGFDASAIGFTSVYTYYNQRRRHRARRQAEGRGHLHQYLYVSKIQTKAVASDLLGSTSGDAVASVIFTDGTSAVIDLKITDNGATATPRYTYMMPDYEGGVTKTALSTAGPSDIGNWFAYTENSDDTYTLSAINDTYAAVVSA